MKRHYFSLERKRARHGYYFLIPWFIGLAAFFIFPFFMSIWFSFSDVSIAGGLKMEWVGLKNYIRAFEADVNFLSMFFGTIRDALINLPLINIFAMFLAILVNRRIRFKGFFRGAFFLPVLLGSGYVMQQLLGAHVEQMAMNVGSGTVATSGGGGSGAMSRGISMSQDILMYLGPSVTGVVQDFLGRFTIILWKSGVQIILYLAGLQGISTSLYESAYCDGASEWEKFWKITLPIISPIIPLTLIYTLIDSFTDISNPMIDYIRVMGVYSQQFDYSAALSWLYLIFVFILVGMIMLILRNRIYNAGER